MKLLRVVLAAVVLTAGAGCSLARVQPGFPLPQSRQTVDPAQADFVLTISNQSFIEPEIRLDVRIDGAVVAEGPFAVGGQHNFASYPLALGPGPHTLQARAESGVTIAKTFEIPADGTRYGVLMYWNYEDEPKRFEWSLADTPPVFG